jgi:hypothetical protein
MVESSEELIILVTLLFNLFKFVILFACPLKNLENLYPFNVSESSLKLSFSFPQSLISKYLIDLSIPAEKAEYLSHNKTLLTAF